MKLFRLLSFLALLFFIHCCLVPAQGPDDEIITVESSIVVLNASIFDAAGKSVEGLEFKQFRVFEDGVEQTIKSLDTEETPFAAVILLDTSGSMETRVSLARSAAIQF